MVFVSAPPVMDEQEALALMVHHLALAAMYFEASPDPIPDGFTKGHFSQVPMEAWVWQMEALYPKDEEK